MNGHSSHLLRLNYECKIECLQLDLKKMYNLKMNENK